MMINLKRLLPLAVIVFILDNGVFCHERQKRQQLKVTTYNTALFDARFTPNLDIQGNREERRDEIIQALKKADTDFVCLQEVWIAEDVAAIVHGVRKKFKYSFSDAHNGKNVEAFLRPGEEPVCDPELFTVFIDCVLPACLSPVLEDLWDCVFQCFGEVSAGFDEPISEDCFICAITAFPNEEIILEECAGDRGGGNFRKMNTKGLLILSKKKLSQTRSVDFFPSTRDIVQRGYLSAKVKGLKAVCTHLSSVDVLPLTVYPELELADTFGFTSYAEQNAFETHLLMATFRNLRRVILLGGFNSGTASAPGVQAFMMGILNGHLIELAAYQSYLACRKLTTVLLLYNDTKWETEIVCFVRRKSLNRESFSALSTVFDTMTVDQCTLCSTEENALSIIDESRIIDHVFTKGVCSSRVNRVFTERDYSVLDGAEMLPLSDHYGVEAKIVPSRACSRLKTRS